MKNTTLRLSGEPPVEMLVYTSKLIFITTIVALCMRRWVDVFITLFQAISALWYHSSHTRLSFYADQISIWLLVTHTFLLAITNTITPCLYTIGFGYMLIVYSYGQKYKCFCFDPDITIADKYHASIHIIGIIIYSSSMIFFLSDEANGIYSIVFYAKSWHS
jgi:hypothetical protein